MPGVTTAPIDPAQADSILQTIRARLQIVLTSPRIVEPGQPLTASLVPGSLDGIDASDLVDGVVNLAGTVKNVVFGDHSVLTVPDTGPVRGDTLAILTGVTRGLPLGTVGGAGNGDGIGLDTGPTGNTGTGEAGTDGDPSGTSTGDGTGASTSAATSEVTGLLAQLFGTIELPRLKVGLEVEWIARDSAGRRLSEEKRELIAPQGINSPTVSLLIPPAFKEFRLDNVSAPVSDIYCLSARVVLSLGPHALGPFEVGPVPVAVLPLLIPTVVALFNRPNFEVTRDAAVVILVPEHSPLSSTESLFKVLKRVEGIVSTVSSVAKFATFLLGLSALTDALPEQPRLRFVRSDGIGDLQHIEVRPRPLFGIESKTFDDAASSILVLGLPGTVVEFYNDEGFRLTDQGGYRLQIGSELFVAIRTLETDVNAKPVTLPNRPEIIPDEGFRKDSSQGEASPIPGTILAWNNKLTSVRFNSSWLNSVRGQSAGTEPSLVCAPPSDKADLAVTADVKDKVCAATVVHKGNRGDVAATHVLLRLTAAGARLTPRQDSAGVFSGSDLKYTCDLGTLEPGASATVKMNVELGIAPLGWSITAVVESLERDPHTADNVHTFRERRGPDPHLPDPIRHLPKPFPKLP